MVQFCGDLVVILIYSVQQKDYTTGQQESYLIYLKLMILSDVSRYDQWPTLQTSSSFFYKGYNYNASLPDSLSENILKCRSNGYSLRGRDLSTVPRFQTRYMKDSLKYRGAVLWYTVSYCEQEVGRSSLNNMKKGLLTRDYFEALKFYILSASTTRLVSTYTYRFCFYLEVVIYVIFYYQIQVIFT